MNLLLDTHVLLWFLNDDPQLVSTAQALVENISLVSADAIFDQYGVSRLWK